LEGTIASAINPSNFYLPISNPSVFGGHHFVALITDLSSSPTVMFIASMKPRLHLFYLNRFDLDFG